jgi:hypothetical protein
MMDLLETWAARAIAFETDTAPGVAPSLVRWKYATKTRFLPSGAVAAKRYASAIQLEADPHGPDLVGFVEEHAANLVMRHVRPSDILPYIQLRPIGVVLAEGVFQTEYVDPTDARASRVDQLWCWVTYDKETGELNIIPLPDQTWFTMRSARLTINAKPATDLEEQPAWLPAPEGWDDDEDPT